MRLCIRNDKRDCSTDNAVPLILPISQAGGGGGGVLVYLGSTYRPQGVTRHWHSPKYHHE